MDEETYLRAQLAALHRSYLEAAEPYVERLAAIVALKPQPPIVILHSLGTSPRLPQVVGCSAQAAESKGV